MISRTLAYALASLRRASDKAYPWLLTPEEAGLLVEEVERLRARRNLDNEGFARVWDESRDRERAAVVAHLRERSIHGAGNIVSVEDACTILADLFERGEHRREEKP